MLSGLFCQTLKDLLDGYDQCPNCMAPEHLWQVLTEPCPNYNIMPLATVEGDGNPAGSASPSSGTALPQQGVQWDRYGCRAHWQEKGKLLAVAETEPGRRLFWSVSWKWQSDCPYCTGRQSSGASRGHGWNATAVQKSNKVQSSRMLGSLTYKDRDCCTFSDYISQLEVHFGGACE